MICECSLICYNAKAAGLAKTSVISAAKLAQLLLGAVLGWGAFVHRVQLAVLGERGVKTLTLQQLLCVRSCWARSADEPKPAAQQGLMSFASGLPGPPPCNLPGVYL